MAGSFPSPERKNLFLRLRLSPKTLVFGEAESIDIIMQPFSDLRLTERSSGVRAKLIKLVPREKFSSSSNSVWSCMQNLTYQLKTGLPLFSLFRLPLSTTPTTDSSSDLSFHTLDSPSQFKLIFSYSSSQSLIIESRLMSSGLYSQKARIRISSKKGEVLKRPMTCASLSRPTLSPLRLLATDFRRCPLSIPRLSQIDLREAEQMMFLMESSLASLSELKEWQILMRTDAMTIRNLRQESSMDLRALRPLQEMICSLDMDFFSRSSSCYVKQGKLSSLSSSSVVMYKFMQLQQLSRKAKSGQVYSIFAEDTKKYSNPTFRPFQTRFRPSIL